MRMHRYRIKIKHDNGTATLETAAKNKQAAARIIQAVEGCPARSILSITRQYKGPRPYMGCRIERLWPSGMYEAYSGGGFIRADTLDGLRELIRKGGKYPNG